MLLDAIQTSGSDGSQSFSPLASAINANPHITVLLPQVHMSLKLQNRKETLLLQYLKGSSEFDVSLYPVIIMCLL